MSSRSTYAFRLRSELGYYTDLTVCIEQNFLKKELRYCETINVLFTEIVKV